MDRQFFLCAVLLLVYFSTCIFGGIKGQSIKNGTYREEYLGSLTPINIVRTTGNNTATVNLNKISNLVTIRRQLKSKHLMSEKDNFYNRVRMDDNYNYFTVINEKKFQLKDILYEGNTLHIGESRTDDLNIFVKIASPGGPYSDRLNLKQSLSEIRLHLRPNGVITENELLYQRRTLADGSNQYYPVVYNAEGLAILDDIVLKVSVQVDPSSVQVDPSSLFDISIVKNYTMDHPVSFRCDASYMEQSLDKVRVEWEQKGRMNKYDDFYKQERGDKFVIKKDDEHLYTLKDIINNRTVLIGSLTDAHNNGQEQINGIVTSKFLNGFLAENSGNWKTTPIMLASLEGHVNAMYLPSLLTYESYHTSSHEQLNRLIQGVNQNSLSLFNVSENYNHNSYCITRLLCQKVEIDIDPQRLTINPDFVQKIRGAISQGRLELQFAIKLVQVLNEYGWYLPKRYVLGGAKYDIKEMCGRSDAEAEAESAKFTASFQSGIQASGFGVNINRRMQSSNQTEHHNETSQVQTGSGQQDLNGFVDALSDPENWQIIKYESFLPSLALLYEFHGWAFIQCTKLLTQFHAYPAIRNLQPNIDIRDYAAKIEIQYSE